MPPPPAPTPTPAPGPAPTPLPLPSPGSPGEGGGFGFGIGDLINGQINAWFAGLLALAVKPCLDILAVTVLATPDLSADQRIYDLWKATLLITDSGFVLLATIGAITAMGHQSVQTRYAVKEVLPRLLAAVLAANASFILCAKAVELANALSRALLGQDFDARRAVATLRLLIITGGQQAIFYILLSLVAAVLLVVLLIAYVMRTALVLLLVAAAPLALACLALPWIDGLARFWGRAFTGLLIIQIAQSLTLVLAVRIFFNQDGRLLLGLLPSGQLVNLIVVLCLLIILIRIPRWVGRRIFAQTGGRGSVVARIVKYAVAYKLASPVLDALHLGRRSGSGHGNSRSGRSSGNRAAARSAAVAASTMAAGPVGTAAAFAKTAHTSAATRAGRGRRPGSGPAGPSAAPSPTVRGSTTAKRQPPSPPPPPQPRWYPRPPLAPAPPPAPRMPPRPERPHHGPGGER
ncbi:hypothetical protein DP939_44510 [Spongiactinospora rosea]|uniref:TrbL/VirB6 plasmid conjugal transfer protein n=1 Tax=Spongiactinospora rosea TaxID=2248750 RepID=A0A366LFT5_9ACTN|nr:hypothetical protein [Spongiactinospora rosea]RBQ12134.1 hypothetical protein DP939_44510 [Spongiactinospora rosea]